MIEVEHMSYHYGSYCAVDDISFCLAQGEIVALIGPNGAGKSTTMKVLTTLLRPESGRVCVAGYEVGERPMEVRRRLGYLPETNPLYEDMLVYDALRSVASQRGVEDRDGCVVEAAGLCGLCEVMHRPIETLSRGYRQRVGIAQAILHRPEVLILDEATTGLDPNQIMEIRDLIVEIGRERTVLISTHILQEVSAIANRVIVMNAGRIVADGSLEKLLSELGERLGRRATVEELFRATTLGLGVEGAKR